jgi:putative mRNA 3-end processing factor
VFAGIVAWWREAQASGRCAILYTYTLGKAQRLLHGLSPHATEPIWVHGAIEPLNALYRAEGVPLAETRLVTSAERGTKLSGALVLAPPSATAPGWLRRFRQPETGFASGWMRLRGTRRRRGLDRGFAISDHVDWPLLIRTIEETGATRVLATHGDSAALVRYLTERGIDAAPLATPYSGEDDE